MLCFNILFNFPPDLTAFFPRLPRRISLCEALQKSCKERISQVLLLGKKLIDGNWVDREVRAFEVAQRTNILRTFSLSRRNYLTNLES